VVSPAEPAPTITTSYKRWLKLRPSLSRPFCTIGAGLRKGER
jgi:hypothetical protein